MKSRSVEAAPYREVTVAAVALGIVQGMIMTAAFVYIGLKLGFGLSGSTVAAILGFALLRGLGRRVLKTPGAGSIVENNINQTIASGINTASSGVVFTFPALLLLGVDFNVWTIILAAIAGSFMGIVIIIPLRKQLIEIDRLRFPSGVAVATILKSPGGGAKKAKLLGIGFAFSLILTIVTNGFIGKAITGGDHGLLPETLLIGEWVSNLFGVEDSGAAAVALLGTSLSLSMANFGAGLLSGRGGLPFFLGGVLAWWIVGPFVVGQGWAPPDLVGDDLVGSVYLTMLRPTGIGILIGGALAGVVAAFPALRGALKALSAAAKVARQSGGASEEMPPKVLFIGVVGSFFALLAVALIDVSQTDELGFGTALVVAVVGTVWLALAGLIVAQATGMTDISPLSGLALIAVTLMLALTSGHVVLAVTIGVAVCIATNQCADMMTDLKTGHLVGGIPRKQQMVQFGVAWIGPAIAIGVTFLLWQNGPDGANGFGPDSPACLAKQAGCLPAPQAGTLQGMIEGVLSGNAPVDKYVAGAAIGGGLALFPIGGLGVLVGLAMYLPFDITLGYGLGCLTSMWFEKKRGQRYVGDVIVPIAAGFIVGEALTNLTIAMIQVASGGGGAS